MVLAALAVAASASANTITVTSLLDDGTNCTLREAVGSANTDSAVGTCTAGSGDDRIEFSNSLSLPGTITLTGGELTLGAGMGSTDILGPGVSQLSVSGNDDSRVFVVNGGQTAAVSGMTIRDGENTGFGASGGGILNAGTLTLDRVNVAENNVIANHTAVGMGTLAIGTGGGIANFGTLAIDHSSIQNNAVTGTANGAAGFTASAQAYGGGIYSDTGSTLTMLRSTVSANLAGATAINATTNQNFAAGGGLSAVLTASAIIRVSTIADNSVTGIPIAAQAFGGGVHGDSATTLTSDTITGNSNLTGGGSNVYGDASLENTIIANGSVGDNCAGTTSSGHNLSDDASCNLGGTGDQPSTDPNLLGLGDYGGPTRTNPPEPPTMMTPTTVIDKGVAAGKIEDQRGLDGTVDFTNVPPATGGDNTDIGAVEIQGAIPTGTTPASPNDDDTPLVFGAAEPGSLVAMRTGSNCTGTLVFQTNETVFVSPGFPGAGPPSLIPALAPDSLTTYSADLQYGTAQSECSPTSVSYIRRPQAPLLNATVPGSGSNNNSPLVKGTTTSAGQVTLYTDAACMGASVGGGPSATLAAAGIPLTTPVPDNSTTTFYAKLEGTNATSSCSATGLTYAEVTPAPPSPPASPPSTTTPPSNSTVVTTTKKCKKGRKLKRGKCVKKKKK